MNQYSPFSILLKTDPHYSRLRIFGCLCFPLLRPYSKDKLSPCFKSCVFLGYDKIHKGYKCFDPLTSKFYVSRRVVYYENTFPFVVRDAVVPNSLVSFNST